MSTGAQIAAPLLLFVEDQYRNAKVWIIWLWRANPGGPDPSVLDANYPPKLTVGRRPLGGGGGGGGGGHGRGGSRRGEWGGGLGGAWGGGGGRGSWRPRIRGVAPPPPGCQL